MFLGHYAVAFAAKKAAPGVRLGTFVMAAQWLDLLWPVFLFLGLEHASVEPHATRVTQLNFYDYPLSHSLLMVLLWAVGFAAVYRLSRRSLLQHVSSAAFILGLCVVSHWVLDWFSHRADMPLWPGHSPLVGMSLWNHPVASFMVEFGGFAIGLAMYWSVAKKAVRPVAFLTLVAFLVFMSASSYLGAGTPPPSIKVVMWMAFAQWILVAWAYAAEHSVDERFGKSGQH